MRIIKDSARQIILFLLFALLFNGNIFSEETSPKNSGNDKDPVLEFVQGKFIKMYLPFDQSFIIAGDTQINESLNIDAVIVKIRTSKDKEIINDSGEQDIFWTRKDKKETTFSIRVDPLPKWKYKYYITLIFGKNIEEVLVNSFLSDFTELLRDYFVKEKGIEKQKIFTLFNDSFKNKFPDEQIYYIREKAIYYRGADVNVIMNMLDRELTLDQRYANFCKLILKQNQSDQYFNQFISTSGEVNDDKKQNPDKYKSIEQDMDSLLNVKKKEDLSAQEETANRINIQINNSSSFEKIKMLLEIRVQVIKSVAEETDISRDIDDYINALKGQIKEIFTESFRSQILKPTYIESETELDRVMVGTVFGFGTAMLSMKNTEVGGFSYMGLQLYFGPVDRRKMDPYRTKLSRWSILVCLLYKSELIYKGQTLGDFWGGFKPLMGIGYALPLPILKAISINGGFIFYSQPNINPLAATDPKPKISIFIGLSFDFDLINRLIKMPNN